MPKSKHRRKKGKGRAPTRTERQMLGWLTQKRKFEADRKERVRERSRALLDLYGPEPEGGYEEWQLHALDMMEDGMPRDKAEARAKAYGQTFLDTFGPKPEDGYEHWQYEAVDLILDGVPCEEAKARAMEHHPPGGFFALQTPR